MNMRAIDAIGAKALIRLANSGFCVTVKIFAVMTEQDFNA